MENISARRRTRFTRGTVAARGQRKRSRGHLVGGIRDLLLAAAAVPVESQWWGSNGEPGSPWGWLRVATLGRLDRC
jgi:hypothetical protein